MTKAAKDSAEARKNLRLLAGELDVSLRGISDADLEIIAVRFVLDGRVLHDVLQGIVDDVRGDGSGSARAAPLAAKGEAVSPPAPKRGYRFNATEATMAKYRQRMALAHRTEDRRTGLYIVPRKPDPLPVDKPHPACLVAARERRGTVCDRCMWLLDDNPYVDAWLDRDDSNGGRL